jgi:hypothetical protein
MMDATEILPVSLSAGMRPDRKVYLGQNAGSAQTPVSLGFAGSPRQATGTRKVAGSVTC